MIEVFDNKNITSFLGGKTIAQKQKSISNGFVKLREE